MANVNFDMTMLQLFQNFTEATNQIDKMKFIIDAMKRAPDLESVSYVATDDNIVIGETYYIKSVGNYMIKSSGKGKISYTIQDPVHYTTLYEGAMDDTAESSVLRLTHGDICYFHASADDGESITLTLQQTKTLYGLMSQDLSELDREFEAINARIDVLVSDDDLNKLIERVVWLETSNGSGRNLLLNSHRKFSMTNSGTAIIEPFAIAGDLRKLVNKDIILSFYAETQGDSEDINGNDVAGRFGAHLSAKWKKLDGTEVESFTPAYLRAFPLSGKRVFMAGKITPPSEGAILESAEVVVELTRRPKAENPKTWIFENPKLEIGTKPTDWTPAFEDYQATEREITLSADKWTGTIAPFTYDLEVDTAYDVELLTTSSNTSEQIDALSKAQISSNATENKVLAWGIKPTIDIPLLARIRIKNN